MRVLVYVTFVCAVLAPTSSFAINVIGVVLKSDIPDPQNAEDFVPQPSVLVQFICGEYKFNEKTDDEGEILFSVPSGPCSIRVQLTNEIYSSVESVYFEGPHDSWLYLYLTNEENQWYLTGFVE